MSPTSEDGDSVEYVLLYTCSVPISVYQTSFSNYISKIISIDFSLMHSLNTQLTSKYLNIDTRSDQILIKKCILLLYNKGKG